MEYYSVLKRKVLTDAAQWVGYCTANWFNSLSGHMPGWWASPPLGDRQEATDGCFSHTSPFPSFSFSLPSPLSKEEIKSF